jgi:hypothetical protein
MKSRAAAAQLALNDAPKIVAPVATTAPATTAPVEAANVAPTPDPNATPSPADPAPKAVVAAKGGAVPVTAPVAKADKPVKEEGAKLSQKDLPPSSALPEGDLSKAMGKAVGADGKPVDAAPAAGPGPQFQAGSVPQRPSQGAVTGAIGAVLPGARACLGPDDAVSRATVTFGSAGTVQSVSVSGGAAGKAAEGCIKAALGKAKVAPFAEATYAAPITIRH